MTREALKDITMGTKEKDRAKNMFVLGYLYWMYNRDMDNTISFLKEKFGKTRNPGKQPESAAGRICLW